MKKKKSSKKQSNQPSENLKAEKEFQLKCLYYAVKRGISKEHFLFELKNDISSFSGAIIYRDINDGAMSEEEFIRHIIKQKEKETSFEARFNTIYENNLYKMEL